MGLLEAAGIGRARTIFQSLDPKSVAVPLHVLRTYPGAAFIVGRNGEVSVIESEDSSLAASFQSDASWGELTARAASVIDRGAASVQILDVQREVSIEATLLPLGDGKRALVLLRPLEFANALHLSLIESRQRYKDFVETVSDFCWETDCEGRFTFVSPRGAFEWSAREMVGRPASDFLAGPDQDSPVPEIFRTQSFTQNDDIWFRCADGSTECLSVVAAPLWDPNGRWRGSRGLCRKVTQQRRRDQETAHMRLQGKLTTHLTHTVQDETDPEMALKQAISAVGLAICATGGAILRRDDIGDLAEIARWGEGMTSELIGQASSLFAVGAAVDDLCNDVHVIGVPTSFRGQANGLALFWREIDRGLFTEEDRLTLEAAERPLGATIARLVSLENAVLLSRADPLTGMLNRRAFQEEVARRIARLEHDSQPASLFFVDLNNFKLVNDVRGHQAGDAILIEVAHLLQESTRPSDLVGRIGGDEFVLWLDEADGAISGERAAAILTKCQRLADRTGDPGRPFGASIGLAVYNPGSAETIDQLLMRADIAMYRAKRQKTGFALADMAEPPP